MNDENLDKTIDTTKIIQKFAAQKRYYLRNRKKINAYSNNYMKKRRKIDPKYRAKLSELSKNQYLDYKYSDENRKNRKLRISGNTQLTNTIRGRRDKADCTLESLPSNIVTFEDMIKYYIYGDKLEE